MRGHCPAAGWHSDAECDVFAGQYSRVAGTVTTTHPAGTGIFSAGPHLGNSSTHYSHHTINIGQTGSKIQPSSQAARDGG